MPEASAESDAHSSLDHTLRLLRALGLAGVLGGLGALSAMWAFTTVPDDAGQWRILVEFLFTI